MICQLLEFAQNVIIIAFMSILITNFVVIVWMLNLVQIAIIGEIEEMTYDQPIFVCIALVLEDKEEFEGKFLLMKKITAKSLCEYFNVSYSAFRTWKSREWKRSDSIYRQRQYEKLSTLFGALQDFFNMAES